MKRTFGWFSFILLANLLSASCRHSSIDSEQAGQLPGLVGAWKAKLQFQTGAFPAIKDLEFMYVFNVGGTMTESSNYDAAPPVPPAYGIWRRVGRNHFEAKYEFYITRMATAAETTASGGGWLPAGRGVFVESITLSDDGNSFTSKIRYEAFDQLGKPTKGGGDANGQGIRLNF